MAIDRNTVRRWAVAHSMSEGDAMEHLKEYVIRANDRGAEACLALASSFREAVKTLQGFEKACSRLPWNRHGKRPLGLRQSRGLKKFHSESD